MKYVRYKLTKKKLIKFQTIDSNETSNPFQKNQSITVSLSNIDFKLKNNTLNQRSTTIRISHKKLTHFHTTFQFKHPTVAFNNSKRLAVLVLTRIRSVQKTHNNQFANHTYSI